MKTKNLAIMFTDMKGFTTLTSTQSRAQLEHLLDLQDTLMRPVFKMFGGRVVKTIGDAFMVVFESPTNAVLCGMKIQENILNHNAVAPSSDQFEVRIAVNVGEVNVNKDGDIFGEAVNIASRIEGISEPNEVYFTEAVYLAMNKNEIPTAEMGERHLKGIPQPVKIYKVLQEKTNLILARIKRGEMAMANANLAKDAVHENIHELPVKSAEEARPEKKQGFFKRHKKLRTALIVIFAFIIFVNIVNKNKASKEAADNEGKTMIEQNSRPVIKDELQSAKSDYPILAEKIKNLIQDKKWPDLMGFLTRLVDNDYAKFSKEEQNNFRILLKDLQSRMPKDSTQYLGIEGILRRIQ